MKLLIVESPNKTKKIAGYLGDGWQVEASFGHIRDLPINEIGVAGPDYFPEYVTGERSGKTIAKLKSLAKNADEIWLATDPDREGEAIAWHLEQVIGKSKPCRRVTFNEITKAAIQKAITSPRSVDKRLFLAQQGRRVLDRLYGYKVSPALGNKLGQRGLSAGRVQSVALRLIVEREEAIGAFSKTKHFGVMLHFGLPDDDTYWQARWLTKPLVNEDQPYITDRSIAEAVAAASANGVIVLSFNEDTQARKPPAPFTTSTLQQAAANKLKISVDATMKAAQALFEAGLITYHRTDSPNLSDDGIQAIWALLRARGQDAYIPDKPNTWKAKGDAQEAHEAIRPTDFNIFKPDTGNKQHDDLYKLIWRRAVASQMKAAVYQVRTAWLESIQSIPILQQLININEPGAEKLPGTDKAQFGATGRKLLFDGWLKVSADDYTNEDEETAQHPLPILQSDSKHKPNDCTILEQETKPPKRYSEPGLVKALEREGIGRPSTYASIISGLQKREYAQIVKGFFQPTARGEAIVRGLRGRFDFMEVHYTKEMEDQLDAIAHGKADYRSVVGHYDQALDAQLVTFSADNSITPLAGEKGAGETYPCPNCDDGVLRRIKGSNGYFWGCSNYKKDPPCKTTLPDAKGKPGKRVEKSTNNSGTKTQYPCRSCDTGYLIQRSTSKGPFWGCSCYPECRYTAPDDNGVPGVRHIEKTNKGIN
ncbi:MAG: type I DNA topoisomerase [Cardiobacteriaceae bacterium]|nr:type I DNA topoisomerase [Cardiobacteriaceae bacterium]